MNAPVFKSKEMHTGRDSVLLRLMAPASEGGAFHAMTIDASRIDYLIDLGDERSGIALKSGAKVPVALPYDDLERLVHFSSPRETPVIDLRDKTGPAAEGRSLPALAADFERAAPAAAPAPEETSYPLKDVPLKIAVFVRQPEQQNFKMLIMDEDDIEWDSVQNYDGKNGAATKFDINSSEGPFDEDSVMIDMSRAKFMELYNLAKMRGDKELDLREWTRRRDPDNTPKPD